MLHGEVLQAVVFSGTGFASDAVGVALESGGDSRHRPGPRHPDRFYRTDQGRSRENGGTGLGLSIVKWAVEVHSGSIGVGAGSKGGSCFYMRLPLSREPLRSD